MIIIIMAVAFAWHVFKAAAFITQIKQFLLKNL
jgi:hypothetical protein